MAITVTKDLEQGGRFFTAYGDVTSAAAADDDAVLIDFSADLNAVVDGKTFTAFKILRLIMTNHSSHLTGGAFRVLWDATANQVLIGVGRGGAVDFDFREILTGGMLNNKSTGFTGDLLVDLVSDVATDDIMSFFLEGELYSTS